ncbi:DUF2829 domain-containing protein [Pectinatus frisingensis]|uniref:DUF2829 domain-containing protein n=1 Tax=Pectinatus frisingensis TaxID=865 RepID=UPI0018C78283|nr:DUF2829 domain-containing protein [Pectinatus frisingensis]
MKTYIGTKLIKAEPAYQEIDLKHIPAKARNGYRVVYPDGYESWSPKDVFEKAYRPTDCMGFEGAINLLKKGYKVARKGWNGKGMWLCLYCPIDNMDFTDGKSYKQAHYIVMKTADDKIVPWLASQSDMLSEDWHIVE